MHYVSNIYIYYFLKILFRCCVILILELHVHIWMPGGQGVHTTLGYGKILPCVKCLKLVYEIHIVLQ